MWTLSKGPHTFWPHHQSTHETGQKTTDGLTMECSPLYATGQNSLPHWKTRICLSVAFKINSRHTHQPTEAKPSFRKVTLVTLPPTKQCMLFPTLLWVSGVAYKCHGITQDGYVILSYWSRDHTTIGLHVRVLASTLTLEDPYLLIRGSSQDWPACLSTGQHTNSRGSLVTDQGCWEKLIDQVWRLNSVVYGRSLAFCVKYSCKSTSAM